MDTALLSAVYKHLSLPFVLHTCSKVSKLWRSTIEEYFSNFCQKFKDEDGCVDLSTVANVYDGVTISSILKSLGYLSLPCSLYSFYCSLSTLHFI